MNSETFFNRGKNFLVFFFWELACAWAIKE